MPLQDVTVTIDLLKPTGLIGFGKTLIITATETGAPYREYTDLTTIAVDYGANSEAYRAAEAIFAQGDNRPERVAIAAAPFSPTGYTDVLAANYDKDWYFLVITSDTQADQILVADYVEANGRKLFAARVPTLGQLQALKANEYDRTFAFYHTDVTSYPEAALIGAVGSREVGSVTWKFKRLNNIVAVDLGAIGSPSADTLHESGGFTYVKKAGQSQTSEGIVISGEYIDVIMSKDWIVANIENSVQALLSNSDKVPMTNAGIGQLEAATRAILQQGYNQDMIADSADGLPAYSTTFKPREDMSAADRAVRRYTGGSFTFELAGAVHEAKITGTIAV